MSIVSPGYPLILMAKRFRDNSHWYAFQRKLSTVSTPQVVKAGMRIDLPIGACSVHVSALLAGPPFDSIRSRQDGFVSRSVDRQRSKKAIALFIQVDCARAT